MTETKTLAELGTELEKAKVELEAAVERERIASSHSTNCRNRLNRAQRAIDAWYMEQKNKAPWNTDWSSNRNRGTPV